MELYFILILSSAPYQSPNCVWITLEVWNEFAAELVFREIKMNIYFLDYYFQLLYKEIKYILIY